MSDESFDFTPSPESKFPKLIMRAFTSPDEHAEWVLTPPNNTGWWVYTFEAQQLNGQLHLTIEPTFMTPKASE